KIAYVRMFSGTVRVRDRLRFGPAGTGKVTAISVFDRGPAPAQEQAAAGQIGELYGLGDVQVGDSLGTGNGAAAPGPHDRGPVVGGPAGARTFFAPPTLETVVVPGRPADKGALRAALGLLAEQDPLINVRQDDVH